MSAQKKGMFVTPDGRNVVFTFALVSSLFLLWGFCNGMIDVMDKHFQDELELTLAQSAWVQFAHYLGYFLMALPAGWLATKLGYKGGIIAGLLMVAVGRLLVHPGHAASRPSGRSSLGVVRHRRRAHLPGDDRQPLHDRARRSRATRRRASTWPSPATASAGSSAPSSAHVLLRQGRERARARAAQTL